MSEVKYIGGFAEPCKTCRWVEDGGYCGNGASRNYGYSKSDEKIGASCPDWEAEPANGPTELIAVEEPEAALSLRKDVAQLGTYLAQLGQMMATMQRRMDEMEAAASRVTIRHAEVKRIQGLIRMRADQICGKYQLTDKDSVRIIRAAIKKDLLKRYGVKDLHDIPESGLTGAESLVSGWTNIRLVMERRERA